MSTTDLLERVGASLDRMGVRKALSPEVPTTDSLATGDYMNRAQVDSLVDLTVAQAGWLAACSVRMRDQRAGQLPTIEITDTVTEGVSENGGSTVATHPDTDHKSYSAKKFQATWFLTLEDLSESRASGEPDLDGKVRGAFGKAMGNDLAKAALRGDTTLGSSTRLDRLLRQRDGWLKQGRSGGGYRTTTRGSAWARTLYPAMLRRMPSQFRDDPDLRWFCPPALDDNFTEYLTSLGGGSQLTDQALTERRRYAPGGIPPILVPQLPTDQGFDTLTGSTSSADTVTDNGDGTITLRVDTLFGGYAVANLDRVVRVTFTDTGETEDVSVENVSSHNVITTAGNLGQSTISTTAGDYVLDVADCAPCLLTNPRNLVVVLCRKVRAYRKWEQEAERWRLDVFYEADFVVYNDDALIMQEGIVPASQSFGS